MTDSVAVLVAVAQDHVLQLTDLQGRCRAKHLTTARADAAFRLYYGTDLTLQQIGDLLGGRHYRTVRYLIERHELRAA